MAGEILKKRREDLGQDIQEISDLLKIKASYLEAIESDAFAELPAPVYTMGYIRCYAKYLAVDADSIIGHYRVYTNNLSQPKHTTTPPVAFSRRKVSKIYYVALLAAVCVSTVFFFVTHARTKPYEEVRVRPGNIRAVETVPPGTTGLPEAKESTSYGEHHLKLAATETTWIYVKFGDGKSEEITLKPDSSKVVKFSGKIFLKIGNAGGVRIGLDEKDLGIPGEPGQVVTLSLPPT